MSTFDDLDTPTLLLTAAYDAYHVIENGTVVETWDRFNGW